MNDESLFPSTPLCPEYPMQVDEGGQAVLDCFLPWHRLQLDRTEYHYSWVPGVPGTKKVSLKSWLCSNNDTTRNISSSALENTPIVNDYCSVCSILPESVDKNILTVFHCFLQLEESEFKALLLTDESLFILNQMHGDEQGTYRCSLQDRNGIVFYRVYFLVTGRVALISSYEKLGLKNSRITTK